MRTRTSSVEALWNVLTAAGGSLALMLIVTMAVGIVALTLLFAGSAVVTLEGFARVVRRWRSLLGFGLVWALFVGAGSLYFADARGRGRGGRPLLLAARDGESPRSPSRCRRGRCSGSCAG